MHTIYRCLPIADQRQCRAAAGDKPVWVLRAQCTVMNDDGAVMDCLLMSLVGALLHGMDNDNPLRMH